MESELKQVNIKLSPDLEVILDRMILEDESDRSKFIRKLIRQEYARRTLQQALPFPEAQKNNKKNKSAAAALAA